MMYGYGNGWIGMIVGLIATLLIIGGLIVFAIWAVRRMSGSSETIPQARRPSESAREITQARYAKGEITREEYQMILSDLDK
jgi:putative membrane protein